jgi:hypothetical protein
MGLLIFWILCAVLAGFVGNSKGKLGMGGGAEAAPRSSWCHYYACR